MAEDWIDALRNSDFGKAIRQQCEESEDVPAQRAGDGWQGTIYGFCPIQGDGTVDDRFWYFRARHEEWSFEVYDVSTKPELPGENHLVWDMYGSYNGDAHNAGWMKFSEAWALIEQKIAAYRRSVPSPGTPEKP